jgi:hypothetical protein
VAILDAIFTFLAMIVFTGASLLMFLKEGKKAFAFLLMAIGFALLFLGQFLLILWDSDIPRLLHILGLLVAGFAFTGYLWPKIRDRVAALISRVGVNKNAEAGAPAPAAGGAPAPEAAPTAPPPPAPPSAPESSPEPPPPPPPPSS